MDKQRMIDFVGCLGIKVVRLEAISSIPENENPITHVINESTWVCMYSSNFFVLSTLSLI